MDELGWRRRAVKGPGLGHLEHGLKGAEDGGEGGRSEEEQGLHG